MGLFDLFQYNKIRNKWTFDAEGVVWRLLFSGDGLIVGEDRNSNARTVSYFCLDESTGKALWLGRKYGQEWWSGIEAIEGTLVFIHSYASPELPEHRGIIAVDIHSGASLWENTEVRFISAKEGSVLAEKFAVGRRTVVRLDPASGSFVEEVEGGAPGGRPDPGIDERRFVFPEILTPGDREASSTIGRHLRREDLVGNVEFIRRDEMLMYNYHEKNSHSTPQQVALTNNFRIVSVANEHVIFSETLNTDVPYPAPDTFFIHDETLYYIKDRSALTAIQL